MWTYRNQLINLFAVVLTTFILCSLQSTLWPVFFGATAAPLPWLGIMLYMVLFRKPVQALFINYGLCLVVHAYTADPLGQLLPTIAIVTASGSYIRRRLFLPSTRYFVMAMFLFSILFQTVLFIMSQILEDNPAHVFFFHRILSSLMTALVAAPLYWFLSGLDHFTDVEVVPESSGDQE